MDSLFDYVRTKRLLHTTLFRCGQRHCISFSWVEADKDLCTKMLYIKYLTATAEDRLGESLVVILLARGLLSESISSCVNESSGRVILLGCASLFFVM